MTQHMSVVRGDKNSGHNLIQTAEGWLRRGVGVLFFPEGTRVSAAQLAADPLQLGAFKPGAFKVRVLARASGYCRAAAAVAWIDSRGPSPVD